MERTDYLEYLEQHYYWRKEFFITNYYRQINVYEFFELIFQNFTNIDNGWCVPFEEVQCEEYKKWKRTRKHTEGAPFVYNALALITDENATDKDNDKRTRIILQNDPLIDDYIIGNKFAITSPITYVGCNRTSENARFLYALVFDLDGVGEKQIKNLFYQMFKSHITPTANIIVNSGNGLHLYYLLEHPIPLYKRNKQIILRIKRELTKIIWNKYTSTNDEIQYQSFLQGFRIPGSLTKAKKEVVAFYNEDVPRHTIESLTNPRWYPENKINQREILMLDGGYVRDPETDLTLDEAKEKFPDWYDRVILKKKKERVITKCHRGLYDWWIKVIKGNQIRVGHRYFACYALVCFAIKCGVSEDEVTSDVLSLIPFFNTMSPTDDQFTEFDARAALKAYKMDNITVSRTSLAYMTGIKIKRNKRNGRDREEHLKRARAVRDVDGKEKWMENNGRLSKKEIIEKWQIKHPFGTKSECREELKFAYSTINKWWTYSENDIYTNKIKEWQKIHPGNTNKSQCARDLKLSRTTITKYWTI